VLGVSKLSLFFILITGIVFVVFPQIDIMVSSQFYKEGAGFYLGSRPWVEFFYDYGPQVVVALGLFALTSLIIALLRKKRVLKVDTVVWLYFVLVMMIVPGLIVNLILKENWGRSRPEQVAQFGGKETFSPALIRTGKDSGYSFVSGHSATGFALLAIALVLTRHRRVAFFSAIAYGSVIGLVRIMQGGHFLSDVVFSFIFVYLTAKILHFFLFEHKKSLLFLQRVGLT